MGFNTFWKKPMGFNTFWKKTMGFNTFREITRLPLPYPHLGALAIYTVFD